MALYDSGPFFAKLREHYGLQNYQTAEDLDRERQEILAHDWGTTPTGMAVRTEVHVEEEREREERGHYRTPLLKAIPLDDTQCLWYERPVLLELCRAEQKTSVPWWLFGPLRSFILWRLFKRGLAGRQTVNALYGEVTYYFLTPKGKRLAETL